MYTQNLINAILIIKMNNVGKDVLAIEFEDGSGKRFNYRLNDSNKWHYIDLTKEMSVLEDTKQIS